MVITDNGSNMVKVFQDEVLAYGEEVDDSEELPGIEDSDHSDEEEDAIITDDFVAQELQHEVAFAHVAMRLPCFAHTLQLAVLKF